MQLEDLDRQSQVAVQSALLAQAAGAKVDIPDPTQMRRDFDAWLLQDNDDDDSAELTMMRALGVSKGR